MSVFGKIIGALTGGLVKEVGEIIDKTSTSDEERMQNQIELTRAVHTYELALREQLLTAEVQLTERHKHDMTSDSWLSKNIRPITLAFVTAAVVLLAYLTLFLLPPEKAQLLEAWLSLFTVLLLTVYSFYFGGRTIEKFQSIKTSK